MGASVHHDPPTAHRPATEFPRPANGHHAPGRPSSTPEPGKIPAWRVVYPIFGPTGCRGHHNAPRRARSGRNRTQIDQTATNGAFWCGLKSYTGFLDPLTVDGQGLWLDDPLTASIRCGDGSFATHCGPLAEPVIVPTMGAQQIPHQTHRLNGHHTPIFILAVGINGPPNTPPFFIRSRA